MKKNETVSSALTVPVRAEVVEAVPIVVGTTIVKHELAEIQEQSLGNSNGQYVWNDGWDKAICSCGWKSCALKRDRKSLMELFKIHVLVSLR